MVSQTILVIENEDAVRENILELLEAEGFQTLGTSNGIEGLALAERRQPQLILCDVIMPHYSGYDVLRAVRQHPQLANVPLVLMSAKAAPADVERGLNAGADCYLTKPFSLQTLLDVIARALESSRTKAS